MHAGDWLAIIFCVIGIGGGAVVTSLQRRHMRTVGFALIIAGIVGAAFWFGYYRHVLNPADAQSSPSINGNCNAIGNNNTSINNDCSTTINKAPKPEMQLLNFSREKHPNGGVTDTFLVEVKSAYAVPRLTVKARTPDVLHLYVNPVGGGTKFQIREWKDDTGLVYSFGGAHGRYNIIVIKSGDAKTNLDYSFD